MAIERYSEGGGLEQRAGMKVAAKKAAKHAAKKHAAKKHPAKKHAAKRAGSGHDDQLAKAYHHLQRASAVVSLLESHSGGDLKQMLDDGVRVYKIASSNGAKPSATSAAHGLARAIEHLAMAGLYGARLQFKAKIPENRNEDAKRLRRVADRLDALEVPSGKTSRRLAEAARELLAGADDSDNDLHLRWELLMAADGIASALEDGM